MEPRPILTAVGAVIVVGVGGLHDLVIGPVDAGHIGELIQFLRVAIHIVHIRAAAQHVVHNGGHLGAGNGGVGPETPVGIAADPAVAGRLSYIGIEPVVEGHVGEIAPGVLRLIGEGQSDDAELRPGNGIVGVVVSIRAAGYHAQ